MQLGCSYKIFNQVRQVTWLQGGGSTAGGSSGSGDEPSKAPRSKMRRPHLFEVEDITPPKQSLGLHLLPANTHNGDAIDVHGDSYVVQTVVLQYKLVRGRYKPNHRRLEVHRTGRFLLNK